MSRVLPGMVLIPAVCLTAAPAAVRHHPAAAVPAGHAGKGVEPLAWPKSGWLRATYSGPDGAFATVGINFATDAWFVCTHQFVSGRADDGTLFDGKSVYGGIRATPSRAPGLDSCLDPFVPAAQLRGLQRDWSANLTWRDNPGSAGRVLVARLPKAMRDFQINEYSAFELERSGGPEGIFEDRIIEFDKTGRVSVVRAAGDPPMEADYAPCGAGQVAAVRKPMIPGSRLMITSCNTGAGAGPPISIQTVEAVAVAAATVAAQAQAVEVTPLQHADGDAGAGARALSGAQADEASRLGWTLAASGSVVVAFGVLGWWKARRR